MAYDVELADRLRELLVAEPVVEKQMFGGLAFCSPVTWRSPPVPAD